MASRLKNTLGAMATAIAMIGAYEGLSLVSYKDVIGVWTACYGETRGIHRGMSFTKKECDQQFATRLVEFEDGMRNCLLRPDDIPIQSYISFLSLSYNIGTHGFCNSSVAKLVNAGRLEDACNRLLVYDRAGGRTIRGLQKRRSKEQEYCLEGVNSASN